MIRTLLVRPLGTVLPCLALSERPTDHYADRQYSSRVEKREELQDGGHSALQRSSRKSASWSHTMSSGADSIASLSVACSSGVSLTKMSEPS